ncbi:MAG: hypothetical protein IPJ87_10110 [Flavobacteriales bacterium]|nr:hypothetical protein [Flavobacteriales bacterium]MBK7942208.1 hypothetical protein [Flavobacteriales bacterium]MBK9701875.1 hypothetical protein [Flavobacteriales bacterium]
MKRAAFCVMVVLAGSLVLSAQNTFVVDFDSVQMGHNAPAYSVVELNDGGFLVGGIQRWHNGDTTGRTHVILRRTDAWGRVIGERALHYNVNRTYNNGLFGAMVRSDTVLVSGITTYGPAPYECTLYLYWFNEDGDTVATKRLLSYSTADSSFIQHWQTVRTMDGGYALCGVFGPPNENGQAIIVRTDVQGDTLWARTYGYPNQEENAYSICELADGGFAITAIELGTGPQNKHTLIRVNSSGGQIWRRQFGLYGWDVPSVRMAADGQIITYTDYKEALGSGGWQQIELRKWDLNGDLIWSKKSHWSFNSSSEPGDFEVLPDGSIICSIWHKGACQLAKFTADGDSIWSRGYVVYTWVGGSENMPYDIDPTSDGGFVVCGETEQGPNDPTPGLQTMFLIKTDSLGCVVPGCHLVGVEEYEVSLQERLRLWPNPATELVRLELELPPGYRPQGTVQAVLLDASGREVLREAVPRNGTALSHLLPLSPLAPGLYHLHLADEKRWLAGGNLLVE